MFSWLTRAQMLQKLSFSCFCILCIILLLKLFISTNVTYSNVACSRQKHQTGRWKKQKKGRGTRRPLSQGKWEKKWKNSTSSACLMIFSSFGNFARVLMPAVHKVSVLYWLFHIHTSTIRICFCSIIIICILKLLNIFI